MTPSALIAAYLTARAARFPDMAPITMTHSGGNFALAVAGVPMRTLSEADMWNDIRIFRAVIGQVA